MTILPRTIGAGCGVIILNEQGQVLLGLKNEDRDLADSELHEEGVWCMPGGAIEYGETFEEAGAREVKEEAGIDISDVEVFCVQTDKNEHAHFVSVGMIAHSYIGTPKVMEPDVIVEWKWFDIDKLPSKIFTPSKKTLDCYINNMFYMG